MTDTFPDKWDKFNKELVSELRRDAFERRMSFIEWANEVIHLALIEDVEKRKQANNDTEFDFYTQLHLRSDRLAQSGLEFKPAINICFARKVDANRHPEEGTDTFELYIPVGDDFDFSADLEQYQFPQSNEVVVVMKHQSDKEIEAQYYRVSPHRVEEYSPISREYVEHEIELGMFMNEPETFEEDSEVHTDADFIIQFIQKLANYHRYYQKTAGENTHE